MKIVTLVAVALTAVTVAALPVRSRPQSVTPHASNDTEAIQRTAPLILGFASHNLTDAELDEIKSAGATFVRTDFLMANVQPTSGSFNWEDLDGKVAAAKAHGLQVLGILAYSPQWNAISGCLAGSPNQCAPADVAAFANYAAAAALHFPEIKYWEISNEPNLVKFWGPSPDASDYVKLLNSVYVAIKNVAPNDVIVAGVLSRAEDIPGSEISPKAFVTTMYAQEARFDILSLHPYTYPFSPDTANAGNGWLDVSAIREMMVANGDTKKKIWITELGAPTCGPGKASPVDAQPFTDGDYMTEAAQRTILAQVLNDSRSASFIEALFIYEIRDDNSDDHSNRENCFGIFRSDNRPKSALDVFKSK